MTTWQFFFRNWKAWDAVRIPMIGLPFAMCDRISSIVSSLKARRRTLIKRRSALLMAEEFESDSFFLLHWVARQNLLEKFSDKCCFANWGKVSAVLYSRSAIRKVMFFGELAEALNK